MTGLTAAEEQALRDAEQAMLELAPRFMDVIHQATEALRPFAWAHGALVATHQEEESDRLSAASGGGHLADMLDTMGALIDDAEDVLREPVGAMVAWWAEGRR